MNILFNLILTAILASIAIVHFYWAFGGNLAKLKAVPITKTGELLFVPGFVACISVGIAFLALVLLANYREFDFMPQQISKVLLMLATIAFLIRAIGDFKYVGFFKKVKGTSFAKLDRIYYSPLCLLIFILLIFNLINGQ